MRHLLSPLEIIEYILGLYRDNGKENGSYHIIGLCTYRGYIEVILPSPWDLVCTLDP